MGQGLTVVTLRIDLLCPAMCFI